jgi:NADPH:quinone reductase-like Zn-dependent oxidoreductase
MAASGDLMRAVRFHEYGDPSVLRVDEVPRPRPRAGEVLVAVRAAGVNPIDWKLRSGHLQAFMPVELPHVPGIDLAGTVSELGPGVTELTVGDDVFGRGQGAYAEYATASAQSIARKPEALSFVQAATLPVGGVTAWWGLFEIAGLESGQRLLVQGGAGGVGALAVQLGRWKGAHVIATTSTANLDFVRSLGAEEVIDYSVSRFEETVGDVDVVFDTVGGDVTDRSWSVLRKGGILVSAVGMPQPERAEQHGVRASGVQAAPDIRPILAQLAALVVGGNLKPLVGQRFPLAEVEAAHRASETGHGRGRIILEVSD